MEADEGYWETISNLARMRGVDKSAISRRVARFEARGLLTTRAGARGRKLVPVAAFDRIVRETTDAVRELNGSAGGAPSAVAGAAPGDPILAREQARRASYDADLKKLELGERLGELAPVETMQEAFRAVVETFARGLDQLPSRAEQDFAEASKSVAGLRAVYRKAANDLRDGLANDLRQMRASRKPPPEAREAVAVEADPA